MKLDIQLFGGRGASSSNNITQSQLDAIEYYVIRKNAKTYGYTYSAKKIK